MSVYACDLQMEISTLTCIIVHIYVCSWRIVVMMLDVWICIGKSLCSGMYKKKGLEGEGEPPLFQVCPLPKEFSALPLEGDSKVQGFRAARKHAIVYYFLYYQVRWWEACAPVRVQFLGSLIDVALITIHKIVLHLRWQAVLYSRIFLNLSSQCVVIFGFNVRACVCARPVSLTKPTSASSNQSLVWLLLLLRLRKK